MGIISDSIAAANVIQSIYLPAQFRPPTEVARASLGPFTRTYIIGGLRTVRSVFVGINGTESATIISAGVGDVSQGQNLAEGYLNSPLMRQNGGFNRATERDAREVYNRTGGNWRAPRMRVQLYGHSAGGALVECLAKTYERVAQYPPSRIVTYGAPKPGFAGATVERVETERRRWMNAGDPVPMVPSIVIGQTMSILLVMQGLEPEPWNCVHGSGGQVLNGVGARPQVDASVIGGAAAQVEEWINRNPDSIAAHSIGQYIRNLTAIVREEDAVDSARRQQFGFVLPDEPGFAEGEAGIHRATDVPRSAAAFARTVQTNRPEEYANTTERRPAMVPPVPMPATPSGLPTYPVVTVTGGTVHYTNGATIPAVRWENDNMAQTKIRTNMRMRVRSMDGSFWVTFQGFTIFTSTKLTKCKTIAKAGNRFLRVMGNDVQINGPNLVTALGTFLALAAIPGNGVNPPLDVV